MKNSFLESLMAPDFAEWNFDKMLFRVRPYEITFTHIDEECGIVKHIIKISFLGRCTEDVKLKRLDNALITAIDHTLALRRWWRTTHSRAGNWPNIATRKG